MWSDLIENYVGKDECVADPFCGSGTTLIAAESAGRVAACVELSPIYVDVAVRRWMLATGKTATRESDGFEFPMEEAGA
jgi:DNA modification methylase